MATIIRTTARATYQTQLDGSLLPYYETGVVDVAGQVVSIYENATGALIGYGNASSTPNPSGTYAGWYPYSILISSWLAGAGAGIAVTGAQASATTDTAGITALVAVTGDMATVGTGSVTLSEAQMLLLTGAVATGATGSVGRAGAPPFAGATASGGTPTVAQAAAVPVTGAAATGSTGSVGVPVGTAPSVTYFTAAFAAVDAQINVVNWTWSDDVAVTGWMLKTTAGAPGYNDAGWEVAQPESILTPRVETSVYPWVKDGDGNVSALYGPVVVTPGVTVDVTGATATSSTDTVYLSAGSPALTLLDDFGSDSLLGYYTNAHVGELLVQNGRMESALTINRAQLIEDWAILPDATFADGTVEGKVCITDAITHFETVSAGVISRFSTSTTHIRAFIDNTGLHCVGRLYGTPTTIGSAYSFTPTLGQTYTIKIVTSGTSVSVSLDGTERITGTTTVSAAGGTGFICSRATWDNGGTATNDQALVWFDDLKSSVTTAPAMYAGAGAQYAASVADGGTFSPALPTGVKENDILLMILGAGTYGAPTIESTGWTATTAGSFSYGGFAAGAVYWKRAGASETNPSCTAHGNNGGPVATVNMARIFAIRGCYGTGVTSPFDVTPVMTGAATTAVAGSALTTGYAGSLVVMIGGQVGSSSYTAPTGGATTLGSASNANGSSFAAIGTAASRSAGAKTAPACTSSASGWNAVTHALRRT